MQQGDKKYRVPKIADMSILPNNIMSHPTLETHELQVLQQPRFLLLSVNTRSLNKNFEELVELVNHIPQVPTVIAAQETWHPTNSTHYKMDNLHDPIFLNRQHKRGGASPYGLEVIT